MKKIFFLASVLLLNNLLLSQPNYTPKMFYTFSYPIGQLTDRGGGTNVSGGNWVDTSGTGNYIQVVAGTLRHPSYPMINGNKIKIISTTASAEDVWRNFQAESLKTVYVSFLFQLIDTTLLASNSITSSEYFIGVLASTQTTAYGARMYARKGTGNNFQLGIRATTNSSSTTLVSWFNQNLSLDEAHLILFSYTFVDPKITVAGSGNDTVKLWIDPSYPDPDHMPMPNAISVATGGYEQPNIGRIFIRQGYSAAGGSTPNAFITNILVDTVLRNLNTGGDNQILKFRIDSLNFENFAGPIMIGTGGARAYLNYNWGQNTTTNCIEENLPNISNPSTLKFKIFRGDLMTYKSFTMNFPIGQINGDERVYGIDSGYISENNVPKLIFSQIVWLQKSLYQINETKLEGFATIDTLRSDPQWLDAIGRQNKSLDFRANSSSLVIQGAVGYYSGDISIFTATNVIGKFAKTTQVDSTDFTNINSDNSRPVPISAIFTPSPTYFANPNENNATWGKRLFAGYLLGGLTGDQEFRDEVLRDTINKFIYPLNVFFGGTHSSYRAKLKLNLQQLLTMYQDSLQYVGIYEEKSSDSLPRRIRNSRIKYIQPYTLLIDSVQRDGIISYYFTKRSRSGTTNVGNDRNNIPKDFALLQNYPNPFNPTTNIVYRLSEESNVEIEIYNVLGKIVESANIGKNKAGTHNYLFKANNISSGIYFYRITAKLQNKIFIDTKKMLLIK